jgi:hypothetical protein
MDVLGEDLVEDFDCFGKGFTVVAVGVEEVSDFVGTAVSTGAVKVQETETYDPSQS